MGNETHNQQYPKKLPSYINNQHTQIQSQNQNLKSFLLIIFTNLVTIYILTSPFSFLNQNSSSSDSIFILKELNSTKAQLVASNTILFELHQRLNSTNLLVQALLIDLNREQEKQSVSWTARNDLEKDFDDGGLDFGIDQVLAMKELGTIRIGLDIGGGTGAFVARMKERNVTIITSTLNLDSPFGSKGLIPMYVNISQRVSFFENTMDIVHSKDVIGNWMEDSMVEFVLYDIYRVLRPGGVFWLDHFFCFGSQLNKTYVPMLDQVGFNKLRWHVGLKLDPMVPKDVWHISALMEKPMI